MSQTLSYQRTTTGGKVEEKTVGAGAVNFIITEKKYIESETQTVKKLELVARNIAPIIHYATNNGTDYSDDSFQVSYEELEFLGF